MAVIDVFFTDRELYWSKLTTPGVAVMFTVALIPLKGFYHQQMRGVIMFSVASVCVSVMFVI